MSQTCPICTSSRLRSLYLVFDDRYGYPGSFPLWSCLECQHAFLENTFKNQDISDLYTKFYPRAEPQGPLRRLPDPLALRSWWDGDRRAYSFVPSGKRVLDIGCGRGETLLYHKSNGSFAVGIDPDRNVVKSANENELDIRIGVFEAKMLGDQKFDYVTMDQVLEHMIDPHKTVVEAATVLGDKGKLILTIPNWRGLGARVFRQKWVHWHAPYHLQHFSKKSIQRLLEKNGMKIEKVFTLTSSSWSLYQLRHVLSFPNPGEPSTIWSSKAKPTTSLKSTKVMRKLIDYLHRYGVNHAATRVLDAVGLGDNMVVIASKVDSSRSFETQESR